MSNKVFKQVDIVVIGASLAGSVTTRLLGQNYRVAWLDPQKFPRVKACGEGLSALGISYLKYLNLWGKDLEQSARPFSGYRISFANGNEDIELKSKEPEGFGISRELIDSRIHEQALQSRLVDRVYESVTSITAQGSNYLVESEHTRILSRYVVLASGGAGTVKLLNKSCTQSKGAGISRSGIAFWGNGQWKRPVPDQVIIKNCCGNQYIVTPLSVSKINISILLGNGSKISAKEHISLAREFCISEGFEPVELSKIYGAAVYGGSRDYDSSSIFLVGDAAEQFDPVGGMGMTHAIYSAVLAAKCIHQGYKFGSNYARLKNRYVNARNRGALVLRLITALSYGLNVNEKRIPYLLVCYFPRLSNFLTRFIKSFFPKPESALSGVDLELLESGKIDAIDERVHSHVFIGKARVFN